MTYIFSILIGLLLGNIIDQTKEFLKDCATIRNKQTQEGIDKVLEANSRIREMVRIQDININNNPFINKKNETNN